MGDPTAPPDARPVPAGPAASSWLRVALLVALLGGSLTPAFPSVHDAFELPKTAALAVLLLAVGVAARLMLPTAVRPPAWVAAFPAAILLHLLLATDGESILAAGHWIVVLLAADAAWRVFGPRAAGGEPESARSAPLPSRALSATDHDLWWAPAAAALAVSIVAMTQFAGWVWGAWPEAVNSTPAAFYGNRNIAAMVLVALVPFLAVGLSRRAIVESRVLSGAALLAALVALLLIRSRASMAALGIGMVACGLASALAWRRETAARAAAGAAHSGPRRLPVLSSSAVLLAVAMLLHPVIPQSTNAAKGFKDDKATAADALKSALSGESEGLAIRRVLAAKSLAMTTEGPSAALLGRGLGRWPVDYPAYNGTGPDWWFSEKVQPEHAHGDIVQLLVEVGWPLGLALAGLGIWSALLLLLSPSGDPLTHAAGGSLVAMLVFAAGDGPLQYAVPAAWIGFLIGLAAVRLPGARAPHRIGAAAAWVLPLAAAAWILAVPGAWRSSEFRRSLTVNLAEWGRNGLPEGTRAATLLAERGLTEAPTAAVANLLGVLEGGLAASRRTRADLIRASDPRGAAALDALADESIASAWAFTDRSLALRPNQINALANRAALSLARRPRDVQAARGDLERALALAPGVWTLWQRRFALAADHGTDAEVAELRARAGKLLADGWFSPYARGGKPDRVLAAEFLGPAQN